MRYSIIWIAAVLIALGLQGINGRALFHHQQGLPSLAPECVSKDCIKDGSIANVFDGYTILDRLDAPIKDPKPGKTITYPDYKYTDLIGILTQPELKFPGDTRFTVMNWDSKNLKEGRESTTVNYGGYNAEKGIIIVDDVGASNDAMTGANRHQSSSITYQSWNQVAGPSNVGNLKMVIQKNVKNLGTRQIAKDAYTRKGLDLKKDTGDWAMDPADDTRQQAFPALLGSDNGRPTEYMLADFHNIPGNKKVKRILTYPYNGVDVEVDDGLGWFHMVLMVGD